MVDRARKSRLAQNRPNDMPISKPATPTPVMLSWPSDIMTAIETPLSSMPAE